MRIKYTQLPQRIQEKVRYGYDFQLKTDIATENDDLKKQGYKFEERMDMLRDQFSLHRQTIVKHLADYNRDLKGVVNNG